MNGHYESAIVEQKHGVTIVSTQQIQTINVPKDKALEGIRIRVSDAAEKYSVNQPTLTRWADAGYISILERAPKLLILDEADVDRAARTYTLALEITRNERRAGWLLKRSLQQSA